MSDRIVYVHHNHEAEGVSIITPDDLNHLLETEDWQIKRRTRKKIDGKMVDEVHLYKPSRERGLSVQAPPAEQPSQALVARDGQGFPVSTNNSFLGTSDFKGLPGLQVASSMQIEHAYAMGVDAAHRGQPASACPWTPGSIAGTQWMRGYTAGGGAVGQAHTQDAYAMGRQSAQGPKNLEVHCPYPPGTPQYNEWLRGFKDGGGDVV